MKIRVCVLILSALLLILMSACAGCVQTETYNVGYSIDTSPLLTLNPETGEPTGPSVIMMDKIAEDQNFKTENQIVDNLQTMLEDSTIDIYSWQQVTDKNKEHMDFSDATFIVTYGFVTKKTSNITIEELLSGDKIITCVMESAPENWLKTYFGEARFYLLVHEGKIVSKTTVDQAIVDVLSSKADAVFYNSITLSNRLLEQYSLKYLGSVGDKARYSIAVKKGDTELLKKINDGYHNLEKQGVMNDMFNKYGYFTQKQTYIVGINNDYPPFSYLDNNGVPTGFDVESLRWIAKDNGFDIEFKYMPWSQGVYDLENNNIDMYYSALSITSDRNRRVTFSEPYYDVRNAVAALSKNTYTADMFERGELSVGVIEGTTPDDWVTGFFGDYTSKQMEEEGKILRYTDSASRQQAFLNGEVDVIVSNTPSAAVLVSEQPVKILKTYHTDESYAAAVRNGDIILLEMINKGLNGLQFSGTRDKLMEKYNL